MKKLLFFSLTVCLLAQLAYEYNRNWKHVVIGCLASLVIWYGFRFFIRPLDIQRVMNDINISNNSMVHFMLLCRHNILFYFQQKLADVGFEHHLTQRQWTSTNKLHLIRSMMRLRKIGALPPVYPNGWFALLDSDQIGVKQVKYVTALGKYILFLVTYIQRTIENVNKLYVIIVGNVVGC